ncbi:MAG: TetR/AcrR family transcriptional regulator [Bacteroidetes bacterium]|nr:TetR/AcrR family transcriptional regulator [Bacteroidota bacterium]
MMQIQKANIRKIILDVSRVEFLEKGYKNTSMRTIAKKSGVGLSNTYNYFKNKDEILKEVLKHLLQAFDILIDEHNSPEYISLDIFISKEYMQKQINIFVEFILKYREELKLLLFKVHGSSLDNFNEEYTNRHTKIGLEYIDKMKEKYPQINTNISDFFIHTISSWWLSIIGEIVSHDLSDEKIKQFISEYMVYATAGWKKILKI